MIGAGLAGCETAWQLAQRGVSVALHEMKPHMFSPAHKSDGFAELVCSNSLRGEALTSAAGLLKQELRLSGSLIISCADSTRVGAGGALAVDRLAFSKLVTDRIGTHPLIRVVTGEVREIPRARPVVIATGPLTSEALARDISAFLGGREFLSFYDAAAPLVSFESIDMKNAFFASRYGKGDSDYINCPMDREQYASFVKELASARQAELHGFEDSRVFEGCVPVEVMARRGPDTLRHGPLKPVGIRNPETGKGYYSVVQLRRDNASGTVYNIVGFQTHLTFPEQRRVFSMIPALKNAEFLRYGVMHRNTYIDSPRLLDRYFRLTKDPLVFFAGQITGVEGYIESAASGFLAGVSLSRAVRGMKMPEFLRYTAIGALSYYISDATVKDFQPMNINFGIIKAPDSIKKSERKETVSRRSLDWVKDNLPNIKM